MITPQLYQNIICELNTALSSMGFATSEIVTAIANMNASVATVAQKNSLNQQLSVLRDNLNLIQQQDKSVMLVLGTLNTLMVSQYGTFTNFIVNNALKIPAPIAAVSATLGFIVPTANIATIC
jgi:hypothetical protein